MEETLKPFSRNIVGEYQGGFHGAKSSTDQIFSMRHWEHNVYIYQISVDFKEVHDIIDRSALCKIFSECDDMNILALLKGNR